MDMTGERRIPAARQKVWDALNDPTVLQACIPGCESLERVGENSMKARAAVKIGPIGAKFSGTVHLTDLDPPNGYRISGEGNGGVAGFAKGGANVTLADAGAETLLSYVVNAQVGGKIAQLGARLIDATSKQMADQFFDRFTATVAEPVPAAAAIEAQQPTLAPIDPAVPGTPLPIRPGIMPPAPASISMLALIPAELFGLPIVAVIGIVLWLMIMFMIFKSVVFG